MGDWCAAAMNTEIMVLCKSDVGFLLLVALLGVDLLSRAVTLFHC